MLAGFEPCMALRCKRGQGRIRAFVHKLGLEHRHSQVVLEYMCQLEPECRPEQRRVLERPWQLVAPPSMKRYLVGQLTKVPLPRSCQFSTQSSP